MVIFSIDKPKAMCKLEVFSTASSTANVRAVLTKKEYEEYLVKLSPASLHDKQA